MGRKSKWNVNNIQEFLDSTGSGCKLITKNFKYLKDALEFQCKCGKHFYRNFHNVVSQKSYYCDDCSRKIFINNCKLSHDDYLKRLKDKGIKSIIPLEKYQAAKLKFYINAQFVIISGKSLHQIFYLAMDARAVMVGIVF